MIKAAVVGGTGYTGVELMRLLARHPEIELTLATSRSDAGRAVGEVYPSLRGVVDLDFCPPQVDLLAGSDVVFFATPNGTAMKFAEILLEKGRVVIDLAADFRLRDAGLWEKWYGQPHACPHLLEEAVYGLPEYNRERIRKARLIACPGCYPTAVQLGFLPLLAEEPLVEVGDLIADCKSGVSGAGRKAQLNALMAECGESFKAYAASGHRHHPEIRQGLQSICGRSVGLTFVPHLVPMIRGIHATLYALPKNDLDFQQLFESFYASEPFVDVLPPGSHPDTGDVRGANRCQIAVHRAGGGRLIVLSVIDNLVKGAAGQAVQNMNLAFGLPETMGLESVALYP